MVDPKTRCAIYTRKSSEDGLEQDFNSLDAQYEACAAYITSQKHEGWKRVSKRYDDGGLSGGTLDRPGLQQLLSDIEAGQIDRIVVYKIDRLTRSLSDFSRIVEKLDKHCASFVSVTQSFNTSTSMGRLTLNMLLSFAQFEREITAERIRDKISASKRKGLWMGGLTPLGYDAHPDQTVRSLQINEEEARKIWRLFDLYLKLGNLAKVREVAEQEGIRSKLRTFISGKTKGNAILTNSQIHHIITNPIYTGQIRHKNQIYEGQHEPIIERDLWHKVQTKLQKASARKRGYASQTENSSWLTGKMFDEQGDRLTPSHSIKNGRKHRYYISRRLITKGKDASGRRLSAPKIEAAVIRAIKDHLQIKLTSKTLTINPHVEHKKLVQQRGQELLAKLYPDRKIQITVNLVRLVKVVHNELQITLDHNFIADKLNVLPEDVSKTAMHFSCKFQMLKRGRSNELLVGGQCCWNNTHLLELLVLANDWLAKIKSGKSLRNIANEQNISFDYLRTRLPLAFLAPDLQTRITTGDHPEIWSVSFFKNQGIPTCWNEQRKKFLGS